MWLISINMQYLSYANQRILKIKCYRDLLKSNELTFQWWCKEANLVPLIFWYNIAFSEQRYWLPPYPQILKDAMNINFYLELKASVQQGTFGTKLSFVSFTKLWKKNGFRFLLSLTPFSSKSFKTSEYIEMKRKFSQSYQTMCRLSEKNPKNADVEIKTNIHSSIGQCVDFLKNPKNAYSVAYHMAEQH